MFGTNLAFVLIGGVCIMVVLYKAYQLHKEKKFLAEVVVEMDVMIAKLKDKRQAKTLNHPISDLNDPAVLATLITVLVKKYGNLRVGLEDFANVKEEEYVSIYVDTSTNDIILSIKNDLGAEDSVTMARFIDTDDKTYH